MQIWVGEMGLHHALLNFGPSESEAPSQCPTWWHSDEPLSLPDIEYEDFPRFTKSDLHLPQFKKFLHPQKILRHVDLRDESFVAISPWRSLLHEVYGPNIMIDDPDTVSAFMNRVAKRKDDCTRKNKELRVRAPLECTFLEPLIKEGFNRIVEIGPTYIVLTEDKSRAKEDNSQKETIFPSANDSHEVASGVTRMQRVNIASSSDPDILTSNQTSEGATLAGVQAPSDWNPVGAESIDASVEGGPAFQHSSRALPLLPAVTGNDNEATGLQGFSADPRILAQTKKRPYPANKSQRSSKRTRGPDFIEKEKGLVLQLKVEFLQDPANEGKGHKWSTSVSDSMRKKGHDRDPKAVRGQWDTLKKNRDALMRKFPQGVGYWDMTMDEKKAYKKDHDPHFPLTFKSEWVVAMANVEKLESSRAIKKSETPQYGQEGVSTQSLPSAITSLDNFAGIGGANANFRASVHQPRQASAQGSDGLPLENPESPTSSTQDLSFLHSWREEDNEEIYATAQEQMAVLQEFQIPESDNLNPIFESPLGDAFLHRYFS